MKSRVAIIRCEDYEPRRVEAGVRRALALLGGISRFVKPGNRVLIKPNLLAARLPETGVDTHPEVVRALIRVGKEAGGKIRVGDSPGGVARRVEEVYEVSGVKRICEEEKVELIRFNRIKKLDGIPLARDLLEADVFISVPKFKTHALTVLTGAVKNVFGGVPGLFKSQCHKRAPDPESLARLLVDIFTHLRPQLSVMDAVTALEGEGPGITGTLRSPGLIIASGDAVALDAVCGEIMGLLPFAVNTTRIAHERGLGNGDLSQIEIQGENLASAKQSDFRLPGTTIAHRIPAPVLQLAGKLVKFKPVINHRRCTLCRLCIESCPVKAIREKKGKALINSRECILCMCCYEICPEGAIFIRKNFLARLF